MPRILHRSFHQFLIFFSILLFSPSAFSQGNDFTLSVTKSNETCTGNGALSFVIANATPNATIVYTIFLLPNTVTPVVTTSASTFGGLTAGNYRVVATQTLGNLSNFDQQDITISNAIIPLAYQLSGSISCNDGFITATITQGNAVNFEIISGPVIRPLQPSNTFTMLPAGVYVVRVYDTCGDALVQTYTLQNPMVNLLLSPLGFPECELVNCNTIATSSSLAAGPGTIINYPIAIEYTVFPPSGAPIVLNQTINSGAAGLVEFQMNLPFFNGQIYTCNVTITDNCGNMVSLNNSIDRRLELNIDNDLPLCIKNIKISACNFVAPITISFLSAPAGFNPISFNEDHPGPFSSFPAEYVGAGNNVMPDGDYNIRITDACGRTAQNLFTMTNPPEPSYLILSVSCGLGQISMPAPNGTRVASVIMNSAPTAYNHTMPYDVSSFISDGIFELSQLPSGTYTFTVVNICGTTYNYTITIPFSQQQPIFVNYIKGCDEGFTSINIAVQSTTLSAIKITSAPTTLGQPLPYDISFNLYQGSLFMNGLPEGTYTFQLTDSCSGVRNITVEVPGYQTSIDNVVVDENCGSFDLFVNYQSNEIAPHSYWLQKLNPITGQWMHPITGVPYIAGALPDITTSLSLINQTNNLNIASIGTFRVLKVHEYYSNGAATKTLCIKEIKNFIFTGGPRIVTAYNLPCTNNGSQITVVAEGLAPLSYFITTKDNQPFAVNNGASNIFSGLTPGIYNFQVQDVCGNIVNRLLDLGSIPIPAITQSNLCNGQNGQLSVPNFPFLNYQWWQGTNTTTILSTTNTLNFMPFSSSVNSGTYYVRIYASVPGLCTDQIISYTIPTLGNNPSAGQGTTSDICGNSGTIDLFSLLTGNFSTNGYWQEMTNSGMQIGNSWLPVGIPYGMYQFKYHVDGLCATSAESIVTINFRPIPPIPAATAESSICASESIHLSATFLLNATYQWTGPNGFSSFERTPIIANATILESGIYSVTASYGSCKSDAATVAVVVNSAPDFNITAACDGNEFVVGVLPIGDSFDANNASYSWSGPDGFTSAANPIVITAGKKGSYTVRVTSENGCGQSKEVTVLNTLCAFPKGVSSNNDGDNENFDLTGFEVINFKVFSRYGNIVYEQNDYTNQWHGQDKNNQLLPDATYYYYVKMKTGEEKTGWVYVTK